ncbi:hypothetical protein CYMTET_49810 [Cymbomonas tetramitiformis]|uniref:Uncharacterized protein n=1 Tax=Cymbomonas tetramitiformis TaxID=36881 RepID=A0AAE0BR57_9CHLO|nr:hypothetical protein CYMTET_49810 [Cymbomonas tetramitiformis]
MVDKVANGEVQQWTARGANHCWKHAAPPPVHHGVSLPDANPQQQIWLSQEFEKAIGQKRRNAAAQRKAFLVRRPGVHKRGLVCDFRWLNTYCATSRDQMEMEIPEKPRRLVLQLRIAGRLPCGGNSPDLQNFVQFTVQEKLVQWAALPFE